MKYLVLFGLVASVVKAQIVEDSGIIPRDPEQLKAYIERLIPHKDVPHPIEEFNFVVVGDIYGVTYYESAVPLWRYNPQPVRAGEINIGENVAPKYVMLRGSRNFFGFDRETEIAGKTRQTTVWIDGFFLKITGVKPK